MKRMDKQAEKKLVASVEKVIAKVGTGTDPTTALAKVASEQDHNPKEIRRIAEAYNQSRHLAMLSEKQGSARSAIFNLADPEAAIKLAFPQNEKSVLKKEAEKVKNDNSAFFRPNRDLVKFRKSASLLGEKPKVEKQASFNESETMLKLAKKQAESDVNSLQRDLEMRNHKLNGFVKDAAEKLKQLLFKTPFEEVEVGLHQMLGKEAGAKLADIAWELVEGDKHNYKRADNFNLLNSSTTLIDLKHSGYASAETLFNAALDFQKKSKELSEKLAKVQELEKKLEAKKPKPEQPKLSALKQAVAEKQAAIPFLPLTDIAYKNTVQKVKNDPYTREDTIKQVAELIQDPGVYSRLKQIRVQSMLKNLMLNDEIISAEDPQRVIEVFNEIQDVAPEVVDKETVMRDYLRRGLVNTGGVGALDAGQAVILNDRYKPTRRTEARAEVASQFEPIKYLEQAAGETEEKKSIQPVAPQSKPQQNNNQKKASINWLGARYGK